MIRKDLIIAILAVFCLTATLFLTKLPVSQSEVKNTLQVQASDTRKSTALYAADAMWVEPNQSIYGVGRFNITVWMNITENVFAYQIGLHYNRTQLKCTRAGYTAGASSQFFFGHTTNSPPPVIDTSFLGNGSILSSECCSLGNDFISGPRCASLIWAEFQILQAPSAGQTFNGKFDISTEYPSNTWVEDENLNNIGITPYDGNYQFTGVPMPFVSISPSLVVMDVGQSQLFTSNVSGGTAPYYYQWYLNGGQQSGANSSSWSFVPPIIGSYIEISVRVTDNVGEQATSNVATVNVNGQLSASVSPSPVVMDVNQARLFVSLISGGTLPFTYQWYLNGNPVLDAHNSMWTFQPLSAGSYTVYVVVADSATVQCSAPSNYASLTVNPDPSISISPSSGVMNLGQSQLFTSIVTGGTSPYSYQWYSDSVLVSGALNATWTFTPSSTGSHSIYVEVTDSVGVQAASNNATITVSLGVHDVAVVNVTSCKTVVGQGCSLNVSVMVANQGESIETFNLTAYANTTIIASQNITLQSGNSKTVTFTWNTTGFALGNYTMSAYAWPVLGETSTADNNFTGGWVVVSMVGDLTGSMPFVPDGECDRRDIAVVANCFGSYVGCSPPLIYNTNCDLLNRGKIDGRDISLVARHFGEHTP
jgi:hypothetical protein